MRGPMIIDAFPINDELDLLECRLVELGDVVDVFVAVEADVDHQDHPKPYHLTDNLDRFARWKDKLHVVRATGLPSVLEHPDPWAREHAQREWIRNGLAEVGAADEDVLLQSDVDEIPRALHVRNCRPPRDRFLSFPQRGHFFAVDWLYPEPWFGTVAGLVGVVRNLGDGGVAWMRDSRNGMPHPHGWAPTSVPIVPVTPGRPAPAGWHLSWLGGPERVLRKVGSFCHPEVEQRIRDGIDDDLVFWREGVHVDGLKMAPVDVDGSWPKWIADGNAPQSWYRPR